MICKGRPAQLGRPERVRDRKQENRQRGNWWDCAVVIKDLEPGAIVAGNPAKSTVKITKVNRAIARLVVEENGR